MKTMEGKNQPAGRKNLHRRNRKKLLMLTCAVIALTLAVRLPYMSAFADEAEAVTPTDIQLNQAADDTVPTDETAPADEAAPSDETAPADEAAPADETAPADEAVPASENKSTVMKKTSDPATALEPDDIEIIPPRTEFDTGIEYELNEAGELTLYGSGSIPVNAFANRTDIKTVKTAEGCSITEIGGNAFSGCNYLKTASLSGVSGNVGSRTFFACTSLTDVSISGNTIFLDANAFFYCNMLRQVSFNANIGTVKSSAISDCQLLEKVSIKGNVNSLNSSSIINCSALKTVAIEGNVGLIGTAAFANDASLETVSIQGNVTTIGTSSFWGLGSLKTLRITGNVGEIGLSACQSCSALETVEIGGSVVTQDNKSDFFGENATLVIPELSTEQINEKAATCTEAGSTGETICAGCKKVLSAAEAVPAYGHDWSAWKVTKAPTATEDGIEERFCRNDISHTQTCGIRYAFTSDAEKWTKGSQEPLTLTIKNVSPTGDDSTTYDKFAVLYVDGKALTEGKDFTKAKGSIIITLKASFLEQLKTGSHSVSVELRLSDPTDDSTSSDSEEEIVLQPISVQSTIQVVEPSSVQSPSTGESGDMSAICVALLLLASFGILFAVKRRSISPSEEV